MEKRTLNKAKAKTLGDSAFANPVMLEARPERVRSLYTTSCAFPQSLPKIPADCYWIHQRRRSKSDDIGTDHDIAGIELPDRPMLREAYNVIDWPPALAICWIPATFK